jgi:hypothetical protein
VKSAPKPEQRELTPIETSKPNQEAPGLTLRIEELEPRLTPQSTDAILQ